MTLHNVGVFLLCVAFAAILTLILTCACYGCYSLWRALINWVAR